LVSLNISIEFALPEFDIALRHVAQFAVGVSMPKASMHEDYCFVLPQNDVGLAGKSYTVQSKSET